MKRVTPAWPAVFFLVFAAAPVLMAQDPDTGSPSAQRQDVDEDEAEFRRRMELEDADDDSAITVPDAPDIVDVELGSGPADGLPPQSRTHLETQLTELIITNGRWEPADGERPAPYVPSPAAETDPELAAQEAAAWEELVAAYHERERAAFEQSATTAARGGADGSDGAAQGGGFGDGGTGPGAGGAGDGSSGAGGNSAQPTAAEGAERQPRGEPFSALEFLGGAAGVEGDDETAPGAAPADTGGVAPPTEPIEAAPPTEPTEDAPPGDTGEAPEQAGPGADVAPSGEAPPGSLPMSDLGVLFEDPPVGETPAADAAPPGQESASPGEDGKAEPASAPPEAPSPSFLDWLLGLFRQDEAPAATPDDTSTGERKPGEGA